jgi:hypothetical protein
METIGPEFAKDVERPSPPMEAAGVARLGLMLDSTVAVASRRAEARAEL